METKGEARALVEAIAVMTKSYLGGAEKLRSLKVELFPVEKRALVCVALRQQDSSAQIEAVRSFFDVQDCYEDELQVELRFGDTDSERVSRASEVKSLVLSN